MRKRILCILAVLIAISLPCAALAEARLGEYVYGAWSAWTLTRQEQTDTQEVETREARELMLKDTWSYKRYVYFNTQAQAWYATSTENPPMERPGSGRWVERSFDAPKQPVGRVGGQIEYGGHWFFEVKSQQIDGYKPVTQYRTRTKQMVKCELLQTEVAVARGETYELQLKLAEGVSGVWYRSTSTLVATVDAQGVVTARAGGSAGIQVMHGQDCVARLQVTVGERIQGVAKGLYSLQLSGSSQYLSPVNGGNASGVPVGASDSVKLKKRQFRFEGADRNAFRIRLAAPRVLYVSVKPGGKAITLQGKSSKYEQMFGILRLKGGQDLLHLTSDPTRFLSVRDDGLLELVPFDSGSKTMRWKLTEEQQDADESGVWALPYARDGKSYISQNYKEGEHNGLDIGSYGERVNALAVAEGKVVYTYSGCAHDYGKQPNKKGELVDPCGEERSFGNQVIIEHANGLRTAYTHLSRVLVKEGDRVAQGQAVGITGSTGRSTAVHLHFEVRQGTKAVNPRLYVVFPAIVKPGD